MSKVHVVTGAAGLIGFELCRQLLARGERVVAADNFAKGGRADFGPMLERYPGKLELVEEDLAQGTERLAQVWREPAASVLHLAAIVGVRAVEEQPYKTISVNMRSTLAMLDLARQRGCTSFFFASSSENYAAGVTHGWIEESF